MSIVIKGIDLPEDRYIDIRLFSDHANIQTGESPFFKELDVEEVPEFDDANELDNNSTKLDSEIVDLVSRKVVVEVIEKLQEQYIDKTETAQAVSGVLQAAKSIIQGL